MRYDVALNRIDSQLNPLNEKFANRIVAAVNRSSEQSTLTAVDVLNVASPILRRELMMLRSRHSGCDWDEFQHLIDCLEEVKHPAHVSLWFEMFDGTFMPFYRQFV